MTSAPTAVAALGEGRVQILCGDALAVLRTLPSESVQVCVTSPPYFGLRDYGTATWGGGAEGCDHLRPAMGGTKRSTLNAKRDENGWLAPDGHAHPNRQQYADLCGKCGARRVDQQIGLEKTPQAFLEALWAIFDEVRRVLHPSGLVFCNIGDSYAGSGKGPTGSNGIGDQKRRQGFIPGEGGNQNGARNRDGLGTVAGAKPKDLLLIPQRFAIGMQERGWWVRSEIVWAKTSAMPESVRDRPTSAWEPIWMFAKSQRYYFDADAVRQPYDPGTVERNKYGVRQKGPQIGQHRPDYTDTRSKDETYTALNPAGANLRNVWTLGPEPSREAHFAQFPSEIPRRCIKAGTSERGACAACGAPWVRCTEKGELVGRGARPGQPAHLSPQGYLRAGGSRCGDVAGGVSTTGWAPSCSCEDAGDPVPQIVLDPFGGSGTVGMVADRLGRAAILIELNESYCRMAEDRLKRDAGPMFEAVTVSAPTQSALWSEVVG